MNKIQDHPVVVGFVCVIPVAFLVSQVRRDLSLVQPVSRSGIAGPTIVSSEWLGLFREAAEIERQIQMIVLGSG